MTITQGVRLTQSEDKVAEGLGMDTVFPPYRSTFKYNQLEIAERHAIVLDFREWGTCMEVPSFPAGDQSYLALRQQRFGAFQYSE